MLHHTLANRISELPDLKVQIAKIINGIHEIEQPEKLFYNEGKWQPKKISGSERQTLGFFKQELATLYTLLENALFDPHYRSRS